MTKDLGVVKVGSGGYGTWDGALGRIVTRILPITSSLLIILLATKLTEFYYQHAWVSAHIAAIAQSFANHGIIGLGGIPIENYDPITTEPDTYLHWPPFFYYVLSIVLRVFPDSIRAMHLFMGAIAVATAIVMWRAASVILKPRAAIVCGSAFLLMPATLRYGLILLPANLALLEVSVAVLYMLRYLKNADAGRKFSWDLGLSALAFFLACVTSWEPFLALPGLLVTFGLDRRSAVLKICICWTLAAMAAGASVLVIYSLSDPMFFHDLWSIFTFRAGLTQYLPLPARIHPVEGQLEEVSRLNAFSSLVVFVATYVVRTQEFSGSLGIMGIFALFLTIVRRRGDTTTNRLLAALLLPLCTLWLGWALVMQNHYIIHEYEMILATPLIAIAIACMYSLLEDSRLAMQGVWLRESLAVLTNVALPCALLLSGISAAWITAFVSEPGVRPLATFGRLIKTEVPAGAIVLTNESSMVPTYYAERHVIRGIPDAAYLQSHLAVIQGLCRTCPIYLALSRKNTDTFRAVLVQTQPVYSDDHFIIKKLN